MQITICDICGKRIEKYPVLVQTTDRVADVCNDCIFKVEDLKVEVTVEVMKNRIP